MEVLEKSYVGVTTAQIIDAMLKESTGASLCDSGGAYGRNWECNQGRDFTKQPKSTASWRVYDNHPEISATVSLYHWMNVNLEFDPEMQARLDALAQEMPDESWLGLQEAFAANEHELAGGCKEPHVVNTYNNCDDWDLTQVLQYVELYTDDDYEPTHLIVSVHQGCDVRGGYGAPKCFKLVEEYYTALESARVRTLSAGEFYWDYQDGGWGDCETESPIDDIMKLPCYDIERLEDPQLQEFDALIAASVQTKMDLKGTTLNEEQRAAAIEQIEATVREVEAEFEGRAIELLSAMHAACTYVKDSDLYLVYEGESVKVEANNNL